MTQIDASLFAFPVDFAGAGTDAVLDDVLERAGLREVTIAANYHAARDVFPHNPSRVAYTFDGGATWTFVNIPFTRCSGAQAGSAGDYGRASDPWISFGPDGTAHYMALVADNTPNRNGMAVARSDDGGQTWQRLDQVTWPGEGSFQEVSVAKVDDELMFWGVPSGRLGGVSLMKVAEADVEDLGAYRYFAGTDDDGEPIWASDAGDAEIIIDRPTGELSVAWNEYLGRWLMTTMADNADAVEKIRAGKAQAIGAIVGAVMRETKGRADGGEVQRLIQERLGG